MQEKTVIWIFWIPPTIHRLNFFLIVCAVRLSRCGWVDKEYRESPQKVWQFLSCINSDNNTSETCQGIYYPICVTTKNSPNGEGKYGDLSRLTCR